MLEDQWKDTHRGDLRLWQTRANWCIHNGLISSNSAVLMVRTVIVNSDGGRFINPNGNSWSPSSWLAFLGSSWMNRPVGEFNAFWQVCAGRMSHTVDTHTHTSLMRFRRSMRVSLSRYGCRYVCTCAHIIHTNIHMQNKLIHKAENL